MINHPNRNKRKPGLTQKERVRYRAITNQLSKMSQNGWDRTTHVDYEPLETELAALGEKMIVARAKADSEP